MPLSILSTAQGLKLDSLTSQDNRTKPYKKKTLHTIEIMKPKAKGVDWPHHSKVTPTKGKLGGKLAYRAVTSQVARLKIYHSLLRTQNREKLENQCP